MGRGGFWRERPLQLSLSGPVEGEGEGEGVVTSARGLLSPNNRQQQRGPLSPYLIEKRWKSGNFFVATIDEQCLSKGSGSNEMGSLQSKSSGGISALTSNDCDGGSGSGSGGDKEICNFKGEDKENTPSLGYMQLEMTNGTTESLFEASSSGTERVELAKDDRSDDFFTHRRTVSPPCSRDPNSRHGSGLPGNDASVAAAAVRPSMWPSSSVGSRSTMAEQRGAPLSWSDPPSCIRAVEGTAELLGSTPRLPLDKTDSLMEGQPAVQCLYPPSMQAALAAANPWSLMRSSVTVLGDTRTDEVFEKNSPMPTLMPIQSVLQSALGALRQTEAMEGEAEAKTQIEGQHGVGEAWSADDSWTGVPSDEIFLDMNRRVGETAGVLEAIGYKHAVPSGGESSTERPQSASVVGQNTQMHPNGGEPSVLKKSRYGVAHATATQEHPDMGRLTSAVKTSERRGTATAVREPTEVNLRLMQDEGVRSTPATMAQGPRMERRSRQKSINSPRRIRKSPTRHRHPQVTVVRSHASPPLGNTVTAQVVAPYHASPRHRSQGDEVVMLEKTFVAALPPKPSLLRISAGISVDSPLTVCTVDASSEAQTRAVSVLPERKIGSTSAPPVEAMSSTPGNTVASWSLYHLIGSAESSSDSRWEEVLDALCSDPSLAWRTANYEMADDAAATTLTKDDGSKVLIAAASAASWLPLHLACLSAPPTYVIRGLLLCHPKSAMEKDNGGRTPLHLAAASGSNVDVLRLLVEKHPRALVARDQKGMIPLHLSIGNGNALPNLEVLMVLLGLDGDFGWDGIHRGGRNGLQMSANHSEEIFSSPRTATLKPGALDWFNPGYDCSDSPSSTILASLWETKRSNFNSSSESLSGVNDDILRRLKVLQRLRTQDIIAPMANNEGFEGGVWEEPSSDSADWPADDDVGLESDAMAGPAAMAVPRHGLLPLHMVVERAPLQFSANRPPNDNDDLAESRPSNDLNGVLFLLVSAYYPALTTIDALGRTPLMLALSGQRQPDLEVVKLLLGDRSGEQTFLPSWTGGLSVAEMAIAPNKNKRQGRFINPAMIPLAQSSRLPLHVAAEESLPFAVLKAIRDMYPAAVVTTDRGQMPLHCSLQNVDGILPSPSVIQMLLNDEQGGWLVSTASDDMGRTPFDLLVKIGGMISLVQSDLSSEDDKWVINVNEIIARESSKSYRPIFIAASTVASHQSSQILLYEEEKFLFKIRCLPPWLRREACACPAVQSMLFSAMASPFHTAIVLLQGVALVATMIVLGLAIDIDALSASEVGASEATVVRQQYYVLALSGLAFYHATVEAYHAVQCIRLSVVLSQFVFNFWSWVNLGAVALLFITAINLDRRWVRTIDKDTITVLGTVCTGMLWVKVVGYLTHWWYGIGQFIEVILKVSEVVSLGTTTSSFYCDKWRERDNSLY